MAAVIRLQNSFFRRLVPLNRRLISTSKKNSDTATITAETKTVTNKNWISYGFETKNEAEDRKATYATFFASITVCIMFGGFILTYIPDYNLRDWAQREAFLEVRRRELLGLPHVDPNLVDPSKIILPSEDELGNTEIII